MELGTVTPAPRKPFRQGAKSRTGRALPVSITMLLTLPQSSAEVWKWKISPYGLHCLVNKAKITPQNRSSQMRKWMNKENMFPDYYTERMNLLLKCGKQNWSTHRHWYNFSLLSLAVRLSWWLSSENPPAIEETLVWHLGWGDALEKGIATHSSIFAWRISQTEKPGELQSLGSQKSRTQLKGLSRHARILSSQVTHMRQQCLHPQEAFSGRRQKVNSNPTPQKETKPGLIWSKPSCVCDPSHPTRMVFCHIEWSYS